MQTTAVIYKTESRIKEVRGSSTSLVSSTSSPGISTTTMRPPPPPTTLNIKSDMKIERGHEEPSSSIPDLEFDGTTVLCRVCGDKASGFHYGVHSCEGCKGFFRRSIQQKIQYRPCTKNQQCSILRINRNRCQYCRLKKCISVGMSRDAVRFGRVPKREKARILAAMQQSSNSRSLVKTISTELEDEHRLRVIVVQAHFDTCDFTSHKVKPMIIRAREHPSYTSIPPTSACPLNPNPQPLSEQADMLQDFSKRFSPAIRGVVEFAKRIPGFSLLSQDDQVTLLKAGVFEVLLVRLACMFDSQTSTMICLNGQVLKRDAIHSGSNARFLMDSMFDFAERLNILGLTDSEIGLFCSIVIIAPDRPGLRDVEFIQKMRNQLKAALKIEFNEQHAGQNHVLDELLKKMPDLRTLNQLHSDKLLAFKMTEQQQLKEQMWSLEEEKSVSPVGSTWSMSSTDEAKSPLGSVSSTESVCTGEVSSLNDYHHPPTPIQVSSNVRNSPLLAASLSGECPLRHRSNSGSSTSTTGSITSNSSSVTPVSKLLADDNTIAATSHLISNNVTVTPIPRFIQIAQNNPSCRISDGSNPNNFEYYEPTHPDFDRTERPERNERIKRMQQTSNENSMPVLRGCLEAPPLCPPGLMMETLYRPHKKFRHSLTTSYKDSAEAEPVNTSSEQCPYSHQSSSSLSSTHSTLAKSLMSSPRMTAEEMKHTDIIHNYIMRGDSNGPSPHVSAEPTVYSAKQRTYKSVITTTNRFQPYFSSPRQDPPSPENRNVRYQSQSPHSTSPTPQLFVPVSCNTPSPKMVELQVDIAESQPLNLSKKSPSPPPLLMKTVLPMEA